MSTQEAFDKSSNVDHPETYQYHRKAGGPQVSDDEPMVYKTPYDYATSARKQRDRLIAEGADPDSVILQSEVRKYIVRRDGEPPNEFAKRYCEEINAMISRGISILNDQCTANVVASVFRTSDGRNFDLGPGSGATKREFREFSQWFSQISDNGKVDEVPEKWAKFEKLSEGI